MQNYMKRLTSIALTLFTFVSLSAQQQPANNEKPSQIRDKKEVNCHYKYQISVENLHDSVGIVALNQRLDELSRRSDTRGLGDVISTALKSSVTQRTVNASSNLISLGVNLIVEQLQKNSKNFESWSKAKQQQCTFTEDLSSEEKIDDFYFMPSTNGALDPRYMKFNGFTCRNYVAAIDSGKPDKNPAQAEKPKQKSEIGNEAFYISCSLRTDSIGIAHLANHSKFMLQVDSLVFYPQYCNIPNINGRKASERFDFDQFTDLVFQIKVKVSSSWINEAVMVTNDQQLGEFLISAKIEKEYLDNGAFIYNGKNDKTLKAVSITGDSFIVPRSFVGTEKSPLWGTGQYKLDMEVSESCQLNATYYKIEGIGKGEAVNFANLPGYKRWDKNIWQTEWKAMNQRKAGNTVIQNAWQAIKTAYIDDNWVKEIVDPIATALYQEETTQLNKLFNLDSVGATTVGNNTQVGAGAAAIPIR
jgi:hypothetical protein